MYATTHKPFVQSVGGIRLLYNVWAKGTVNLRNVCKGHRSPTGQLIALDGSVNFCERFVVRGGGGGHFDDSPYRINTDWIPLSNALFWPLKNINLIFQIAEQAKNLNHRKQID